MALDFQNLLNWKFDDVTQTYSERDTILYALGVGYGTDPLDEEDLRFVYEERLQVVPSMAVVLGYPGFWLKDPRTGVNWPSALHGEQGVIWHAPLRTSGTVIGRNRVKDFIDKGPGKGALLYMEREIVDALSGEALATLTSTSVLRADGGSGGPTKPVPLPHRMPEGTPDRVDVTKTSSRAALIYRLSGDRNALHVDPKVAASVGFSRPILQGLCTFGLATRALLRTCCENNPARLKSLQARFSSPVFPGEEIATDVWCDGAQISFRCRASQRDKVVIDNGLAMLNI